MSIHLVGGGRDQTCAAAVYGGFVVEATARARRRGRDEPVVGVVVVRGPDDPTAGADTVARFVAACAVTGPVAAVPVVVDEGDDVPPGRLGDPGAVDALLVAGGLTPAYATALRPVAAEVRALVADGVPYLGFSAGAAVAARRALVGGYRQDGVPVCPADNAEDLDEVTVVDGLGLVDLAVEVHAAQWGNLGRLVAAVGSGAVTAGVAVDEDTVLVVDGPAPRVGGAGRVWWVAGSTGGGAGVAVHWTPADAVPAVSP